MDNTKSMNLTTKKISTSAESVQISAPLTPTQRADLVAIRQSMRDMRREIDEWTVVADGLHRALREVLNCEWLRLDPTMMSLPMDPEMLDDILERASDAMSKYVSKIS
jgi:hypothetical protein